MPTWVSTVPELAGLSPEKKIDALLDAFIEQDKRLQWLTARLDSKNVKRLDTNETSIKSANGETYINGPIIEQKDADNVLRLKQGLDTATEAFVFALFNSLGIQTVGIDSNGNAIFTGTITGGVVRSGVAGTNRIEMSLNKFRGVDSDENIAGLFFEVLSSGIADVSVYHSGTKMLEFYDGVDHYVIRPGSGILNLHIGADGKTIYADGTWDFSNATVIGLP